MREKEKDITKHKKSITLSINNAIYLTGEEDFVLTIPIVLLIQDIGVDKAVFVTIAKNNTSLQIDKIQIDMGHQIFGDLSVLRICT